MGKTWKNPENSHRPSVTPGDSNLRQRSFVQRQVMGKQSKDKDSEVFRTVLNGFNMLQRFDFVEEVATLLEAPVFWEPQEI
jgi:hypothetical protein